MPAWSAGVRLAASSVAGYRCMMSQQEQVAALLREADTHNQAGRHEAMRTAFERASGLGSAYARHNLAICLAGGVGGSVDRKRAQELAQGLADEGDPQGRQMLAVAIASGWKDEPDYDRALALREDHARQGDMLAHLETALLLAADSPDSPLIEERLRASAAANIFLARAALARWLLEHDPASPDIDAELRALEQAKVFIAGRLRDIQKAGGHRPASTPGSVNTMVPDLNARTIAGAIPAIIADYAVTRSLIFLRPAQIYHPSIGMMGPHPHRKSLTATLHLPHQDLVLHWLERRMAALAGLDWNTGERLVAIAYRKGEEYRPHVDYFSEADGCAANENLQRYGQRIRTALVTLYDGFEGGATQFPRFDASWRGAIGDALVFDSTSPTGEPLPLSLHAGEPVSEGLKIIGSIWYREKPFLD